MRLRIAVAAAAGIGLAGCGGTSGDLAADLGALGVGTAVGAATGNPAIGIAAGIGARVAADEGYRYGERRYYRRLQTAIAAAGGQAEPGDVVEWSVGGVLGIGDSRGRVEVVRAFGETLRCKELVFTVEPEPQAVSPQGAAAADVPAEPGSDDGAAGTVLPAGTEVLTTAICEGPDGWAWAGTRPSTTRWGGLQ